MLSAAALATIMALAATPAAVAGTAKVIPGGAAGSNAPSPNNTNAREAHRQNGVQLAQAA